MSDPITEQIFETAGEETVGGDNLFEGEGEKGEEKPESPFKEKEKPQRHSARASGESVLTTIVTIGGSVLVNRRIDPGVGRVLQLESPLLAQRIDKAIAGTFLDKILQPLFRKGDDLEGLGAALALPIMVGVIERKPELYPMMEPMMEEIIGTVLEEVAPLVRKSKTKRRAAARTLTDINDAFDIPRGEDPIKAVMGFLFMDSAQTEGEEPQVA